MSRRLTPYLFAGLLGVVSGVYIFRPLFDGASATREMRGAAGAVTEFTDQPQSSTVPQEGE